MKDMRTLKKKNFGSMLKDIMWLNNTTQAAGSEVIYASVDQTYSAKADDLTIKNTCANIKNRIPSPTLGHYGHGTHYSGITPGHDSLMGPTVPPPNQVFTETEKSSDGSDTDYDSDY